MKVSLIFLLTILSSLLANNIYAQEAEFDTTYNIEYSVDNSLEVSVKENIAIINQNASAVPSSFIETITNISVYGIKVYDSKDKEITPEIEEKDKSLIIKIPIENPAVGKDKKTQITLSYKTRDLAQKTGRILNITVPKAPVSSYMQEYNVSLKIPKDFGPQISITPKPVQEKMEEEGYVLLYNKQTLEQYGISASFGDYQIFDFEIGDELQNSSVFSKNMELVLPPLIKDYQEISITEVTPKPLRLIKDIDGNVLAIFRIAGKSSLAVKATGKAKIYTKKIDPTLENSLTTLPGEVKKYLAPNNFWQTKDSAVENLKSQTDTALKVYTYLTKNIAYDFESATQGKINQRKGGVQTLTDRKGLCLDFTDAFITLARANGIPAREINGYAYTKDQKTTPAPLGATPDSALHAWAQYYHLKYGWVSVDSTWGATSGLDYFSKLDNNHLAFVIKGVNPQSPKPPATIKVDFSAEDFFTHDQQYDLENLPNADLLTGVSPFLIGAIVVGLGLCTTLVFLKGRPKVR